MAVTKPTSPSGFYSVRLNKNFEHESFLYSPGADQIVVNEEILDAMIEAGVVASVKAYS